MGNFIFWVVNDYSENEIPKKMFADEALKDTGLDIHVFS